MDDGLPDEVAHALALAGVPAEQLQLEITESSVMTDPEGAMSTLHRVAALGVGIAVDDFGTGYSSLIHLKELPVERSRSTAPSCRAWRTTLATRCWSAPSSSSPTTSG